MNKCNIPEKIREQITAKAGLVGLGVKVRQLGILKPVEEVKIAQKTVKYTPYEKLTDVLIAIMSGAAGLVEVNKRVRRMLAQSKMLHKCNWRSIKFYVNIVK
jgi:hypothetical protein